MKVTEVLIDKTIAFPESLWKPKVTRRRRDSSRSLLGADGGRKMGEGLGWAMKHARRQARDAQHFTFRSCESADRCSGELYLFTYPWKGFSLIEIDRSSAIDFLGSKAGFRDLSVSSIHQSKEVHLHVSR